MNKYLLFSLLFSAAVLPVAVAGKTFDKASFWRSGRSKITEKGDGVLAVSLPATAYLKASEKIPVTAGKVYKLSGEFRFTGKGSTQPFWFGLSAYNADGRVIERVNVNRVSRMLPTVAVDAAKGSEAVELKGALNAWARRIPNQMAGRHRLAFGAAADGSDLPNFRLSGPIKVKGIVRLPNGNWQVGFTKPLEFDVKAGESVGFHHIGMTYMYVGKGKALNGEWTAFSCRYSTAANAGVQGFYPTTAAVGIAMSCHQRGEGTIEFRNLSINEEK